MNQVLAGEGVGWLKINRLKNLMKDESYRDFIVTKLNKNLSRKISPDDRIDDVVSFLDFGTKCYRENLFFLFGTKYVIEDYVFYGIFEEINFLVQECTFYYSGNFEFISYFVSIISFKNTDTIFILKVHIEASVQRDVKVSSGSGPWTYGHVQ